MPTAEIFKILYDDDWFIAINKPSGILVHRTPISEDRRFVLQLLRNQIGQRIYPAHRLDRGTSGVLVFGKNREAASRLAEQLRAKTIEKEYLAIVRGYIDREGIIDYPLSSDKHKEPQEAITRYELLRQIEIEAAISRYKTARYSLVKVIPETGKMHQIRKHFSHIRHPVIGDKKHGDIKHNKYFKSNFNVSRLLLHSSYFAFRHPESNQKIEIKAPLDKEFTKALQLLGFE